MMSLTGIGHGQDTGASVPQVEVLVLELLAVDALTTSALLAISILSTSTIGCTVRCHG